jgi:hypothetical protein
VRISSAFMESSTDQAYRCRGSRRPAAGAVLPCLADRTRSCRPAGQPLPVGCGTLTAPTRLGRCTCRQSACAIHPDGLMGIPGGAPSGPRGSPPPPGSASLHRNPLVARTGVGPRRMDGGAGREDVPGGQRPSHRPTLSRDMR